MSPEEPKPPPLRWNPPPPSRELDAEIALANGWTHGCKHAEHIPIPGLAQTSSQVQPPRYNRIIDAALSDLPTGRTATDTTLPEGVDAYVSTNTLQRSQLLRAISIISRIAIRIAIERQRKAND